MNKEFPEPCDSKIVWIMRRIMLGLSAPSFGRPVGDSEYVRLVTKKFKEKFPTLSQPDQEQMLHSLQAVSHMINE